MWNKRLKSIVACGETGYCLNLQKQTKLPQGFREYAEECSTFDLKLLRWRHILNTFPLHLPQMLTNGTLICHVMLGRIFQDINQQIKIVHWR